MTLSYVLLSTFIFVSATLGLASKIPRGYSAGLQVCKNFAKTLSISLEKREKIWKTFKSCNML